MSAAPAKPNPIVTGASFVVGIFTRNLGAKISALILAVVVWFTVRQDIEQTVTVRAQVDTSALVLEGLMPMEGFATRVTATFTGPNSEIAKVREEGNETEISLSVGRADMLDKLRQTFEFRIENGNVEHGFSDEVHLVSIDPAVIKFQVAVKEEREIPVREPITEGVPAEWQLEGKIKFTDKIFLQGPKDRLDALDTVPTKPIRVAHKLTGNGERDSIELTGFLDLTDEIEKERIRPVRNQRIAYTAVFRRTRVPQDIPVPFVVKYESLDGKVRLEVDRSGPVQLQPEGLMITLTFKGSQAYLDKVKEGVKDGRIRAYVRAEDNEDFRNGKEGGGGRISPVRLEMPDELRRRVSFKQPDLSLTCRIVPIVPR